MAARPQPLITRKPPDPPDPKTLIHPVARQWERNEHAGNRVALTFDAGGEPDGGSELLAALAAKRLRVTFFLTGRFVERFPAMAKAIADAGHEIGSHSYSHPKFTTLGRGEIADQLERAEQAIGKVCGRGAKPLFRFPYGDSDHDTERAVAAEGYQAVYWSLDSLDSVDPPKSADYLMERVLKKVQPGQVILMHVGNPSTAAALPRILDGLEKKGLAVVPVSELMANAESK